MTDTGSGSVFVKPGGIVRLCETAQFGEGITSRTPLLGEIGGLMSGDGGLLLTNDECLDSGCNG